MDGVAPARPSAPDDRSRIAARHVVLVGSMGVGKTTVGRMLAERMGRPHRDSDDDLAAAQHRTGRMVAAEQGVDDLHRWEAEHLLAALRHAEPSVIAAAASTVEDDRCVEALRDAHVVWLRASPETLARRIARQTHRRDLGPDPVTTLGALEQARAARYAHVADLTVDVDHSTPTRTVDEILTALAPFPTRGDPR